MLVLDANVALAAATSSSGFRVFEGEELVAPPLLWPEVRSALHVAVVRGLLSRDTAERSRDVIESGIVRERRHRRLGRETWGVADELGWSKTYDAEYLALARLLGAKIVTLDTRVARAAERVAVEVDERLH